MEVTNQRRRWGRWIRRWRRPLTFSYLLPVFHFPFPIRSPPFRYDQSKLDQSSFTGRRRWEGEGEWEEIATRESFFPVLKKQRERGKQRKDWIFVEVWSGSRWLQIMAPAPITPFPLKWKLWENLFHDFWIWHTWQETLLVLIFVMATQTDGFWVSFYCHVLCCFPVFKHKPKLLTCNNSARTVATHSCLLFPRVISLRGSTERKKSACSACVK